MRSRPDPERWAKFGAQARRCHALPCVACVWQRRVQTTTTEAHHEPPLAHGGRDRDTVPLCKSHHDERHAKGPGWWAALGLDLDQVRQAIRLGTPSPGDPYDAVPY